MTVSTVLLHVAMLAISSLLLESWALPLNQGAVDTCHQAKQVYWHQNDCDYLIPSNVTQTEARLDELKPFWLCLCRLANERCEDTRLEGQVGLLRCTMPSEQAQQCHSSMSGDLFSDGYNSDIACQSSLKRYVFTMSEACLGQNCNMLRGPNKDGSMPLPPPSNEDYIAAENGQLPEEDDKAWIAIPVVLSLAGLALVVVVRRHKKIHKEKQTNSNMAKDNSVTATELDLGDVPVAVAAAEQMVHPQQDSRADPGSMERGDSERRIEYGTSSPIIETAKITEPTPDDDQSTPPDDQPANEESETDTIVDEEEGNGHHIQVL